MLTLNNFLKTFECLVAVFTTGSLIYLMLDLTGKETSNQDIYFKQVIKTVLSTPEGAGNIMRTMDQNQNEAVHKRANILSDTIKKLMEEEKIFAVFEEQKKRLHRMDIYCKNLNQRISQTLNEYAHRWQEHILVDDDRKFLYCAVAKTGSTNMKWSLIESNGKISKEEINRSQNIVEKTFRSASTFVRNDEFMKLLGFKFLDEVSPPSDVKHKLDNYFKFLVVRDPWTRLLSAYRDKFEKNNSAVLDSFQNYYGRNILERYRINASEEELQTGSGVKFGEFLQFIIDEGRYGLRSKHWMSIHDMCHPCLVKYNYIAKLETMNQDSAYLLHRISNNIVQFPDKHLDPKSDSVTDSNFTDIFHRYYSSVPIKVLDGIRKLYALDFEMFGYDINEV